MAFLRPYKFTIAFENSSLDGYVSEKIVEPMAVFSLPIYWGSPSIGEDFNQRSFVNLHNCGASLDDALSEAVNRVIAIDKDDGLYLETLRRPWFEDNLDREDAVACRVATLVTKAVNDSHSRNERLNNEK